jgi:3'-5' exoribonuclease
MTAPTTSPAPAPETGRRFVQQLGDGDAVEEIYLVGDKQLRANRNGNQYLQIELRDRTGAMSGRLWHAGEALMRSFEAGDFVSVKGKVQLFQGALQMIINVLERVAPEQVDLADFLPHTTQDVGKLYERLRTHLRKLDHPHLRALADAFLMDAEFVRAFCKCPAGVRNHHAYVGGLLEHVVTLMDGAERLAALYPELNRDLLIMGCFLHDIGKVRELNFERIFGYSDEGQLIGHIVIGVEMLDEQLPRVAVLTGAPFPRELLLRLKHLIVSHHGTYEFGSPKLPMTPEAIALHHLDNFDAKVHSFTRDIREDSNKEATWTPFNPSMDRRLFKGRSTTSAGASEEGEDD